MTITEVVPFVLSIGVPLFLFLFATKIRIPGWSDRVSWKKANVLSLIVSIILGAATASSVFFGVHEISAITWTVSIAVLAYTMVQTFFTDPTIRKADRGTMIVAWSLTLPSGLLYYLSHLDFIGWYEFLGWIAAVVITILFVYLPGFGASDGRAAMIAASAGIPIIGFMGVFYAFLLYALLGIGVVVYLVLKYRVSSLQYVKNVSIPAVPFIILPFLVVSLITIAFMMASP